VEQKPLSRLERLKADKDRYSPSAARRKPVPEKTISAPSPASGRKTLSDKSIDLIAKALQVMLKE
jgi:hypothetical protein